MKKYTPYILIILAALFVGLAMLLGYNWGRRSVPIPVDTQKYDSTISANTKMYDSLSRRYSFLQLTNASLDGTVQAILKRRTILYINTKQKHYEIDTLDNTALWRYIDSTLTELRQYEAEGY